MSGFVTCVADDASRSGTGPSRTLAQTRGGGGMGRPRRRTRPRRSSSLRLQRAWSRRWSVRLRPWRRIGRDSRCRSRVASRWEGSTRPSHSPSSFAIDWNRDAYDLREAGGGQRPRRGDVSGQPWQPKLRTVRRRRPRRRLVHALRPPQQRPGRHRAGGGPGTGDRTPRQLGQLHRAAPALRATPQPSGPARLVQRQGVQVRQLAAVPGLRRRSCRR